MFTLFLVVLRVQPHGCKEASRFEDCEEYIECLADPPNCTQLVIVVPISTVPSQYITGTIPSAIGNLTALTKLNIGTNGVSGTIPETIGLLTSLTDVNFCSPNSVGASGRLSGTLPPSLGNLTHLEKLWVSQTQISGTLPPSLGRLTALRELHMLNNALTGVIPETIFELTALTGLVTGLGLVLSDNELSGTLSDKIGKLTALRGLYLGNNRLSGTLPTTIGELTHLEVLSLPNIRLSGTVPDTISRCSELVILLLQNNSFTAVGGGICAIQDHLKFACDLSDNEIPGTYDAKGGKTNCPVCLNNGKCNKHNRAPGEDLPIFPNKACDFTRSQCACWAPSPTVAPTFAPTSSAREIIWDDFKKNMCFGYNEETAPAWCFEITFALLIGAVFIVVFCVFYAFIIIPCHALCESRLHGYSYREALWHALTHQCWCCCSQHGREEHGYRVHGNGMSFDSSILQLSAESTETETDATVTNSTLEAPFLLDAAWACSSHPAFGRNGGVHGNRGGGNRIDARGGTLSSRRREPKTPRAAEELQVVV